MFKKETRLNAKVEQQDLLWNLEVDKLENLNPCPRKSLQYFW